MRICSSFHYTIHAFLCTTIKLGLPQHFTLRSQISLCTDAALHTARTVYICIMIISSVNELQKRNNKGIIHKHFSLKWNFPSNKDHISFQICFLIVSLLRLCLCIFNLINFLLFILNKNKCYY